MNVHNFFLKFKHALDIYIFYVNDEENQATSRFHFKIVALYQQPFTLVSMRIDIIKISQQMQTEYLEVQQNI